jgi:hypothetical protein
LRVEARCRYPFLTRDDLEGAIVRMRSAAATAGDEWIDPRPAYVIVASKPPSPGESSVASSVAAPEAADRLAGWP